MKIVTNGHGACSPRLVVFNRAQVDGYTPLEMPVLSHRERTSVLEAGNRSVGYKTYGSRPAAIEFPRR